MELVVALVNFEQFYRPFWHPFRFPLESPPLVDDSFYVLAFHPDALGIPGAGVSPGSGLIFVCKSAGGASFQVFSAFSRFFNICPDYVPPSF